MTRTVTATGTGGACCPHSPDVHQHLRPGTNCGLCDCPRWRPARSARLARLRHRIKVTVFTAAVCAGVLVIVVLAVLAFARGGQS